jgi:hypothetical protein
MSDGQPTKLVRDAGVESCDPPPDEPFAHSPEPIESSIAKGSGDLRRADDQQQDEIYDKRKAARAAWDVFDQMSPGHP